MTTKITLSKEFTDGFDQSASTAMMNLADMITVEMKKLAPFARPSQYKPRKYKNSATGAMAGGSLVKSLKRTGQGKSPTITSNMPYAIRRNYENNLNPQTKKYIERSITNVLRGRQSQWWQA